MFGTFRTALALLVVVAHLGPLHILGPYAVFAFYVLSGFLMTKILQETYGYGREGFGRFLLNRFLRIFPMYWVAVLVSLSLVWVAGNDQARQYHTAMGYAQSPLDVLSNASLVLSSTSATRWVPPAWALTIELGFYILIGIGLSRSARLTALWLAASFCYSAYLYVAGASFSYRYFTFASSSLPFAVGAGIFHLDRAWSAAGRTLGTPAACIGAATLFLVNMGLANLTTRHALGIQFYLNIVLAAVLIWALAGLGKSRQPRWDDTLGALSYPIYLLHYQAGLVLVVMGYTSARGSWEFLLPGLVITLLMSMTLTKVMDPILETLRGRIRAGSKLRASVRTG